MIARSRPQRIGLVGPYAHTASPVIAIAKPEPRFQPLELHVWTQHKTTLTSAASI